LAPRPFNRQGEGYNPAAFQYDGDFPGMDEHSDEALMARIAGGDRVAFDALARRHAGSIVKLASHILGNRAEADDVAQEALLRVWTHAPRWKPVAQFRTWLMRIVVNLCLDRKRRAFWLPLESAGEVADPTPDADARHEADDNERRLAAAIARLPPRQRAAIALSYAEGLSNAEAAGILDTSVSAVETLLARAKASLRQALGKGD
jgi:RNA polymerase sigma-70 factor (ECF subfamily)